MEIPVPLETAVRDGRAVLFLGAGASMEALDGHGKHPPNAQQLSELLAARFLGGRYKHLPLSQVAEYAINETDLRTVQDFIKDTFERFQPSAAHLLVPQFTWWASPQPRRVGKLTVGHPTGRRAISGVKLEAMVEGARIASKQLWVSR